MKRWAAAGMLGPMEVGPVRTHGQSFARRLVRRGFMWFHRTGTEMLGWTLIVVGIAALVLPGPGTLMIVAGVALLAPHYAWADRVLATLRVKAFAAAEYGVATKSRIALSAASIACVVAAGFVWYLSPDIPVFDVLGFTIGPELPLAGIGTAIGIWVSATIAAVLLVYSIRRWGGSNKEVTV